MTLLKSKLHLILIILFLAALAGRYLWDLDSNAGYAPDQPIPFSHKIHAGDYKMDCLYCHSAAEKGPHAGIPPMNVCMGCHSVVAMDKPNVQKLNKMFNAGETVQWARVHRLPDHVYFSHKWHLRAGIRCQECHGEVETMPLVSQVNKLEMGNCLDCHRKSNFSQAYRDSVLTSKDTYFSEVFLKYPYMKYINANTIASLEKAGLTPVSAAPLPPRPATGVFADQNALTQCSTCHQ